MAKSDALLRDALDRFRASEDGSAEIRKQALEDIEFARLGKQWPDEVVRMRKLEGRPCLTINRLPSFIRQVVNDARQNKPAMAVHAVDGGADYQTAQVLGGLLRSIERASNAGVAYDTAIEQAVTGGFGFFRIVTDYAHEDSFDIEARIERVPNSMSVHWDTNSLAFDASDWEYAFVSDMLTEREYKKAYPKADPVDFDAGLGDDDAYWRADNTVRVAEYFLRVERERKIVQLSDGRVIRREELEAPQEVMPGLLMPGIEVLAMAGITPTRERSAKYCTVTRRVMTSQEVLSEDEWPGSMIPICPVWGEEVIFRNRRHFRSLVRDARDPQAMFNFWRTASTEMVALAPRAPFLVATGQIPAGPEGSKWGSANTRSYPYLSYNPVNGAPMPQRQAFPAVPAGAIQEALNAADDMKAVMGIYDASLGARSNETSGRAILARQRESDVSTFHFIDNLSRAIQYGGRVLLEVVRSAYSQRQAVQILGPDQAESVAKLTQENPDPANGLFNLDVGKYDVTVKVGASYATQREEAREALLELMRADPRAALVLGDLALKNMDFPGADEAAERVQMLQQMELARMAPPQQPAMAPPGAMPQEVMPNA
jgi:hypothetical protein